MSFHVTNQTKLVAAGWVLVGIAFVVLKILWEPPFAQAIGWSACLLFMGIISFVASLASGIRHKEWHRGTTVFASSAIAAAIPLAAVAWCVWRALHWRI